MLHLNAVMLAGHLLLRVPAALQQLDSFEILLFLEAYLMILITSKVPSETMQISEALLLPLQHTDKYASLADDAMQA
ncbi:hypothetical protein BS78_10G020700 [Paspalum vaginatum]|nr:hypothetical protein BS78_10G020700 [Paspalum vaginatum]